MKIKRGIFARHSVTSHTFAQGRDSKIKTSESNELKNAIDMAKEEFIEDFNKLKFEENYITIDLDQSNDTVSIYKEKLYSDDFKESSKTYTIWLETQSKKTGRVIKSKERIFRNPDFENNPECDFCYKKVTQVFKDHLLNKEKTEKMVCANCKKELAVMRKIVKKIEEDKKVES